jgi:hypothetical protein
MASKQDFTPDEWTKLLESAMAVGAAVSAADPSGLWGTFQEFLANSGALDSSKLDPNANELVRAVLVRAVVVDFGTEKGRSEVRNALHRRFDGAKDPADCVQRSLDSLWAVSAILDSKAPSDAPAFKAWLCGISRKVAEAAVEGGLFGFGGVRVSKAEAATLDDISRILGLTT